MSVELVLSNSGSFQILFNSSKSSLSLSFIKVFRSSSSFREVSPFKYFKNKSMPKLNLELHEQYKDGQLKLF